MTALAILDRLASADIELWVEGDAIRWRGPSGVLTAELRDLLKAHKSDIIDHLKGRDTTPPDPELAPKPVRKSYPCSRCDRIGLFPSPDAVCYWCRHPDPGDYDEQERRAIQGEREVAA